VNQNANKEFSIGSRAQAELFVSRQTAALAQYGGGIIHISLPDAFSKCQHLNQGTQVFAAIFDIYINAGLLWIDAWELGCTANAEMKLKKSSASALESPELFKLRMNEHRHANSFVFRYRAIWDKIMGLFVLLAEPSRYESYIGAKSRKAAFRKICEKSESFPKDFGEQLSGILTSFDNAFRTPEAHGTGRLRKFTFALGDPIDRPTMELSLKYWNVLNEVLHQLGTIITGLPVTPEAATDGTS
jgi:hypothetical protein